MKRAEHTRRQWQQPARQVELEGNRQVSRSRNRSFSVTPAPATQSVRNVAKATAVCRMTGEKAAAIR